MDTSKELLGVSRKLSLVGSTLLAGVAVLSSYLVQRAVWAALQEPTEGFDSMDSQWTMYRLKLSFGTMTIAWPLVLGLALLGVTYVTLQRDVVWGMITKASDAKEYPEELDALRLDLNRFPHGQVVIFMLRALPIAALAAHAVGPAISLRIAFSAHEPKERAFWDPQSAEECAVYLASLLTDAFAAAQIRRYRMSVRRFFNLVRPEPDLASTGYVPEETVGSVNRSRRRVHR